MAHVLLDQAPRDLGGEQRVPTGDGANRIDDPLRRRALEQEPAGARPEGLVDVLVEVERGEDHHARTVAAGAQQSPRRLESAAARTDLTVAEMADVVELREMDQALTELERQGLAKAPQHQ
jgi:hypothetical protein